MLDRDGYRTLDVSQGLMKSAYEAEMRRLDRENALKIKEKELSQAASEAKLQRNHEDKQKWKEVIAKFLAALATIGAGYFAIKGSVAAAARTAEGNLQLQARQQQATYVQAAVERDNPVASFYRLKFLVHAGLVIDSQLVDNIKRLTLGDLVHESDLIEMPVTSELKFWLPTDGDSQPVGTQYVELRWFVSSEANAVMYDIARGEDSPDDIACTRRWHPPTNARSVTPNEYGAQSHVIYKDPIVEAGHKYYYVIVARDPNYRIVAVSKTSQVAIPVLSPAARVLLEMFSPAF